MQETAAQRTQLTWMSITLASAATYNILWGGWVILFPDSIFNWMGLIAPRYPQLWQCIGMIVATYGVGYAIAARDPLRHWPIVLVGLIGKTFGLIGFLSAAAGGQLPWTFGITIVANDLIWLVPFALVLRAAFVNWRMEDGHRIYEETAQLLLDTARTTSGETLSEMSRDGPVLLVFLRHSGCTFCKEAAADLAKERATLEALGVRPVLVHMGTEQAGERFFAAYGLENTPRVSDPERTLYRAFKLRRGRLGQLLGFRVWYRGVEAAMRGHWPGWLQGDFFQMPGILLLRDGQVVRAFRHATAADRPEYAEFVCGLYGEQSRGDAEQIPFDSPITQ